MKNSKFDEKALKKGVNEFEWTTPLSKNVIKFKLTTHKDEKVVNETLDRLKKLTTTGVSKELTTRLKQQIIAVDDNTDKKTINDFVDNQFLSQDTRIFREHIKEISPDIDFDIEIISEIGEPHKVSLPVGVRFFWPEARV